MTTYGDLWAAVYRRKAEHAAGDQYSEPDYRREHTCHADCPCHTGGQPTPDFIGDGSDKP